MVQAGKTNIFQKRILNYPADISKERMIHIPELSNFEGIYIYLRFNDIGQHYKPHVHVKYNNYEAVISLDGELLAGSFPQKQK